MMPILFRGLHTSYVLLGIIQSRKLLGISHGRNKKEAWQGESDLINGSGFMHSWSYLVFVKDVVA